MKKRKVVSEEEYNILKNKHNLYKILASVFIITSGIVILILLWR